VFREMRVTNGFSKTLALLFALILAILISSTVTNLKWVLVMSIAALTYGLLSPLVAARRLYFLASASPHSALLASVLAIPLARIFGVANEYIWAIVLGLFLTYIVGYMIHRGIDTDTATATFVAFTASASVIAIYYVLTSFPLETDIWAIIVGDPLLADWDDVAYASIVMIFTTLTVLLTCREQICLGIDKDYVRLAGIRVEIYDWIMFTLLGLTTVTLIRIVGFVLEHVLVLLPAAIATTASKSAKDAMYLSIISSFTASILGLHLAVALGLAPAGITGLSLLTLYVFALLGRRRK